MEELKSPHEPSKGMSAEGAKYLQAVSIAQQTGKTIEEAETIKNSDIVLELNLPPIKIHCSLLAEDAIKSAIENYRKKQIEIKQ